MLFQHLPGDSVCASVAREGGVEWTLTHSLLDDLRMVWTGSKKDPAKPHALRPRPQRRQRSAAVLAAARERAADRKARIERGDIT